MPKQLFVFLVLVTVAILNMAVGVRAQPQEELSLREALKSHLRTLREISPGSVTYETLSFSDDVSEPIRLGLKGDYFSDSSEMSPALAERFQGIIDLLKSYNPLEFELRGNSFTPQDIQTRGRQAVSVARLLKTSGFSVETSFVEIWQSDGKDGVVVTIFIKQR